MANSLLLLGAGKSGATTTAGKVSITANDSAAAEDGSNAGQFTVTLSVASSTNTVIAYSVGGTATATTDYTALSGTVTIIASATTATIDVSGIIDDAIVEANETVIVTLDSISSGDSGITIDATANAATVTITDDDVATVSITANDAAAAEAGTDAGQFTVTQTAASSTNTVIAYTVTGDATPTTDYTALTGSVTITAGSTTATIDVTGIIDDSFVEANETVIVTLDSISSGDSHVTVNGAANVATVTITDDDVATVSITATDATAAEAGTNPGQFTVTQTQVSSTDTVIAYTVTGTATATTDYTALSGTATIAAGVTTAFINVSGIIDDAIVEGDETVIVTLDSISSGDSHVTINGAANVAIVTITDDESSITVVAPDGSESWALDSTQSITWSDVNLSGNVKIELYKDGSLDSVLSADEANDSTYSWAIDSELTEAADYKIRITSLVDGTVYDESDANFELAEASSYDPPAVTADLIVKLDVADPDSWDSGSPTIWTNTVDDVDTTLINGPTYDDTDDIGSIQFDGSDDYATLIRASTTANLGNGFTVVLWFNAGDLDSSGYTGEGWIFNFGQYTPELGVSSNKCTGDVSGLASYGFGNSTKTWCDQRILTDTWYQAVWRNNDDGSIDAWLNGAKDSTPVTGYSTARPGSNFHFASEGTSGSHPLEVKLAQVLVYNTPLSDAEVTSLWDGDAERFGFSYVRVTAPNGGELWESDTTESITWSSVGLTGNVKIELYKDGSLDSTLTSDTANTGSYSWAISAGLADGSDYKIRITSLADGTVYDESDANFDILSIVTDDLLLYFDAGHSSSYPGSGTTLTDLKGSNNGTLTNGPTYSSDYGGTLVFDGSDDYVTFDLPDEFDGISLNNFDCTQEAWCRFDSIIPYGSVICFHTYDLQIMPKDANNIGVWVSDATLTLGASIAIDTWYHFALTKSGNTYTLYVDGQSVGSVVDSDNLTIGSVGQIGYNGASSYLDGQIPILRLYDQALTAEEVEQNFDAEKGRFAAAAYSPPAVTSGLVVKLDVADPDSFDSTASTVWTNTVDSVDGTLTNGPTYDDGSGSDNIPLIYFDGSNDYYHLARDNSAMDEGFTLCMFVKPHAIGSSSSGNLGYWWAVGFLDPTGGGSSVYSQTQKLFSTGHGSSGTDQFADGDSWVMDDWNHCVWRNNNDGDMDTFVNGVKATTAHDGYNVDDAPADNFGLAQLGGGVGSGWFIEISIAQFLVYDRPLSDSEVGDLWDGDKERFGLS